MLRSWATRETNPDIEGQVFIIVFGLDPSDAIPQTSYRDHFNQIGAPETFKNRVRREVARLLQRRPACDFKVFGRHQSAPLPKGSKGQTENRLRAEQRVLKGYPIAR